MMTLYTTTQLIRRYHLNPEETFVTVTRIGSQIIGTSACLREADTLSLHQLLFGMMLPSGNDAAYTIANYFGEILYQDKYNRQKDNFAPSWEFERTSTRFFLREMNEQALRLKMYQTNYDSPHGLMNKTNVSTAQDQARMAAEVMKDDYMRMVVGTATFECKAFNTGYRYSWENTNRLLTQ